MHASTRGSPNVRAAGRLKARLASASKQPGYRRLYLSERRLDHAKHLLAHTNVPLVEISLSCRFSGQANFNKAFTRANGVSPGRYRRTYTEDGPAVPPMLKRRWQ